MVITIEIWVEHFIYKCLVALSLHQLLAIFNLKFMFNIILYLSQVYSMMIRPSYTLQSVSRLSRLDLVTNESGGWGSILGEIPDFWWGWLAFQWEREYSRMTKFAGKDELGWGHIKLEVWVKFPGKFIWRLWIIGIWCSGDGLRPGRQIWESLAPKCQVTP